jgi:periplasmic divalent cation tolerance protein
VNTIIAETDREHPYEVPGLIALPILDGNPAYLQWIRDVTRAPSET